MSIAMESAGMIRGATGSGKGSVLWSLRAAVDVAERQILVRVDRGGILIGERELRYQLQRKDSYALAQADELLDVLAELEARGLIEAERCFWLTALGRERLTAEPQEPGRAFAVMEDGLVLCADCVQEAAQHGAERGVQAWIEAAPGVCCEWCGETSLPADGGEG